MSKSVNAGAQRDAAKPTGEIGLGELENHLGYFVRRLQHWIFRDVNAALAAVELDVILYSILETIAANPGTTQIAVAGALGIERARMVGLLDDLQQSGLIVRERSDAARTYDPEEGERRRRGAREARGAPPRRRQLSPRSDGAVAVRDGLSGPEGGVRCPWPPQLAASSRSSVNSRIAASASIGSPKT